MLASTSSPAYGNFLALHIVVAVAVLAIFVVMRTSAAAVAKGASPADQAKRFPNRPNLSARLFYLLPITGMAMTGIGGSAMKLSQGWLIAGLILWVLAAGHLEARVLPSERKMAAAIAANGTADPAAGKKLGLSIDVLLTLIIVAAIVMIWQP